MNDSRTGLNLCRGANLPLGSHHSAAMREKRSTSAGSMLDFGGAAEEVMPFHYRDATRRRSVEAGCSVIHTPLEGSAFGGAPQ
jgi:hypothetical protein